MCGQFSRHQKSTLALEDIIKDVERLKQIKVDQDIFSVDYYMGGDWKFLASITGIDQASSTYSCIQCKCGRDERYDPDKEWSVTDSSKGARSVEEIVECAALPTSKQKFNVSHVPLFPTIPLSHVVIDNLHLFSRVADVLINLLITELHRQDSIDQRKRFTGQFDISKFKHLENYEKLYHLLVFPISILCWRNTQSTKMSVTYWSRKVKYLTALTSILYYPLLV